MKIIVSNDIKLFDVPFQILNIIKKSLTIDNPAYDKANKLGISTWGIPKQIRLYDGKEDLILPRGYGKDLINILKHNNISYTLDTSGILKLSEIEFNSSIKLRNYQEPAVQAIIKNKNGVIIMPCGAGKTITGLQIAASLKQRTLWITHTGELLTQTLNNAINYLNLNEEEHGTITAGKSNIGSIFTVATVQTLASIDLSEIKNMFGTVIIDEAHHTFKNDSAVGQFNKVISELPAMYRIGLTASEHRSDGLIDSMFKIIGPKVYEVTQEYLNKIGKVIIPHVKFVYTNFVYDKGKDSTVNFAKFLSQAQSDEDRNNLILRYINNIELSQPSMILSDRLSHLSILKEEIEKTRPDLKIEFIRGNMNKKERKEAMERIVNGESNILMATYKLAQEGLDIPQLIKLFLVSPKRDKTVIQQSVGRIMRPAEGKNGAIVYDFVDIETTTGYYQAKDRLYQVYIPRNFKLINEDLLLGD